MTLVFNPDAEGPLRADLDLHQHVQRAIQYPRKRLLHLHPQRRFSLRPTHSWNAGRSIRKDSDPHSTRHARRDPLVRLPLLSKPRRTGHLLRILWVRLGLRGSAHHGMFGSTWAYFDGRSEEWDDVL